MATKIRVQLQDVSFHVFTRCHNLEDKFKADVFKEIVFEVVKKTQEYYNFEVSGMSVLDNHVHMIIKTLPEEAKISLIMQYIKARITERYNKMTGRLGTLWNERYGSKVVEHTEDPAKYLNQLLWYLAYNPVRKGSVKDPRDYRYSTILAYLDKEYVSPVNLTLHEYYYSLGSNFQERLRNFLRYEERYRQQANLTI